MNTTRVYPIRTTRKEWKIPIYCKHVCNTRCSKIYSRDQSDLSIYRYFLIDNPMYMDGKCERNNLLEKTFIRLSSFNLDNPTGGTGILYEPYNIVIPDTNISVLLTYPLSNPVNVNIISQTSRGFTLAELIYSIKTVYQYIYREEERTSTPISYHIKTECKACINPSEKQNYVTDLLNMNDINIAECSICYNIFSNENEAGELICKHIYHKKCILKWLETSKTCPLCRKNVSNCDICNGSEFIYHDYQGVVIPLEHRGVILNRNTTDGIFGIFGYDLEDLIVENLYYQREKKLLILDIGS